MSQDMTGVFFLSICNSLFEILTNVLSIVNLDKHHFYSLVDIGFSTIVGSALVEFTVVLTILRFVYGKDIKLEYTFILRDLAFYSIGLIL